MTAPSTPISDAMLTENLGQLKAADLGRGGVTTPDRAPTARGGGCKHRRGFDAAILATHWHDGVGEGAATVPELSTPTGHGTDEWPLVVLATLAVSMAAAS